MPCPSQASKELYYCNTTESQNRSDSYSENHVALRKLDLDQTAVEKSKELQIPSTVSGSGGLPLINPRDFNRLLRRMSGGGNRRREEGIRVLS
ncbi:unnamed protein product [Linum trigynum]|uniref:Uncharacterized protein n=1 Tax=Linum trigynum TaxID=586398 RepID=A0AAV2G2W2_9ROSI